MDANWSAADAAWVAAIVTIVFSALNYYLIYKGRAAAHRDTLYAKQLEVLGQLSHLLPTIGEVEIMYVRLVSEAAIDEQMIILNSAQDAIWHSAWILPESTIAPLVDFIVHWQGILTAPENERESKCAETASICLAANIEIRTALGVGPLGQDFLKTVGNGKKARN